jgi:hypothetical protein
VRNEADPREAQARVRYELAAQLTINSAGIRDSGGPNRHRTPTRERLTRSASRGHVRNAHLFLSGVSEQAPALLRC